MLDLGKIAHISKQQTPGPSSLRNSRLEIPFSLDSVGRLLRFSTIRGLFR